MKNYDRQVTLGRQDSNLFVGLAQVEALALPTPTSMALFATSYRTRLWLERAFNKAQADFLFSCLLEVIHMIAFSGGLRHAQKLFGSMIMAQFDSWCCASQQSCAPMKLRYQWVVFL